MAVQFRDYYETLGVGRGATHEEIRSAFRKMARTHHPDVAKNKKAGEEKFKEINEAYEVLGDEEKRKKYDALGANMRQGEAFPPSQGGMEEEVHFGGTGFSDFFEMFTRMRSGHSGQGGRGYAEGYAPPGRDVEAEILVTLEEALHGSTRTITLQTSPRNGRRQPGETYTVKIPAGIREGQRIRLAGKGEGGGHLFLHVRLERHPDFRVQGEDLYYDLELAPWEAVLGAQVQVPTLGGRVALKVAPGTQSGATLRLAGMGLAKKGGMRGDLFAKVIIEVPTQTNADARLLWEQLAKASNFNPRKAVP